MPKAPIQKMFDSIADCYDFLNHTLSLFRDVAWRKHSVRLLKNRAPKDCKLLDLCGGTGDFSKTYSKELGVPQLSVVGDFSYAMLSKVNAKSKELISVQLDATKTPFIDQSFDVILNAFGMRNLLDTAQGLEEVQRLLKPKGYFLTLEFFSPIDVFSRFFYKILAPLFIPFLGSIFSKKKEAYEYLVRSVLQFLSVKEYQDLAERLNFQCVSIKKMDMGIAYAVLLQKLEVKS